MPSYFYTAVSYEGEQITGTEQVQNKQELAQILRKKGYVLTSAEEEGGDKSQRIWSRFLGIFGGVSIKDKLIFIRNLKVMVGAGVPLPKAFGILERQTENHAFKKALADIRGQVMHGKTLSEAMAGYPNIFPQLFINMIAAGEQSGTLGDVLEYLTVQMEREHELRSKVKGAMLYPAVILTAMFGVGAFMLIFVVPRLAETFDQLGVELPLTTRVVIGLGTFLANWWYAVAIGLVILGFGIYRGVKTTPGKKLFDRLILRVPIVSGIVKQTNAALTTRTISSLVAAGVPIVEALKTTSDVVGNYYFSNALLASAERVKKGDQLSESLQEYTNIYPIMVVQMIQVGEETGETPEILQKVAEFFEEEVANTTDNLTSIIEPILMLIIGVVVGLFAVSMFQPMYSMVNVLQ